MKKRKYYHYLLFYIAFICCTFLSCVFLKQGDLFVDPSSFQFQPITFSPPQSERLELKNGIVLYLLEDHELPIVEITATIRVGAIYEPEDLAGLASITGEVMRTGGTLSLSSEKIDETLESIDAQISVSFNSEAGTATLSVLKKDLAQGLDIFSKIIREPAFEAQKVSLAKKQTIESLRRTYDNPQGIAFREFKKLLYKGNPRGNLPTIESVKKIKRDDLIKFYKEFVYPDRILLAISGDFQKETMLQQITEKFGNWKPSHKKIPSIPPPNTLSGLSIFHFQKEIPQSTIIIGHFAPPKSHPDYFSFQVLNYILGGGGFSSRLTSKIRSSMGLAYSVGSFYRADVDYGVFGAYCMTKSASTHQVIELMLDIINAIKQEKISTSELDWAKKSLLNRYIFSYSSSAQIVNQQMLLEYEHLPPDFLEKVPENIKAVTIDNLYTVAQKYLHPSKAVLFIIGDKNHFNGSLNDWGVVEEITPDI